MNRPGFQGLDSFRPFVFTNRAPVNSCVFIVCTCTSIYISRSGTAGSKAIAFVVFITLESFLSKSFSWTCCFRRFMCAKKRGPHSRQIRVFLTTGFVFFSIWYFF